MLKRPIPTRTMVTAAVALALCVAAMAGTFTAPADPDGGIPRMADGRVNLSGIWQANTTANWDLLTHRASQGPVTALGAAFSVPGGVGVVEGDEIPYTPEARARKQQLGAAWLTSDPEIRCFLPGVPRATYMPYPFQIVQGASTGDILMTYEFAAASRIVRMSDPGASPVDSWMGWSRGRWDGDTLVVDVSGFNGEAWFDRAGNFQTPSLHVVERYTPRGRDVLDYEATIEDPAIYTRPWKIRLPLYRRLDANAQLVEYKCVEFVEELMYGHLVKKPGTPAR